MSNPQPIGPFLDGAKFFVSWDRGRGVNGYAVRSADEAYKLAIEWHKLGIPKIRILDYSTGEYSRIVKRPDYGYELRPVAAPQ